MDLDQIRMDIHQAREWAKDHFNVHQEEDHILAPPTFVVEFPEPDRMVVWPRLMGQKLQPGTHYRLAWRGRMVIWVGKNPLTGQQFELIVA